MVGEGEISEQENPGVPYALAQAGKADIIDRIRPEAIVDKIRHNLQGEELNPATGKWEPLEFAQKRALTSLGAWELSSLMLSVSSQNLALSHLTEREIKKRVIEICDAAMEMCLKNWVAYGITGIDQFRFVYEIIKSNTLFTLKQPLNNEMKNFIKGVETEVSMRSNIESRSGGNFISNMMNARKQLK